jgi:glycosyltransferase involved in cell wall biosynthesis
MKICLVSYEYPPYIYGGAGTYAELLVRGLEEHGIDLSILAYGPVSEIQRNVIRIKTPDIKYWRRLFFSYYGPRLLTKFVKKNDIDLIHFNEPHIIITTPETPLVSSFHSTQINEFFTNLPLHRASSPRNIPESIIKSSIGSLGELFASVNSDHIICPCMDLKKKVQKHTLKKEGDITVIPNGIDTAWASEEVPENHLSKFDLKKDKYFLFMGRLAPIKGIEHLLQSFRAFNSKQPDYKLAIAGSGFYEQHLRSMAKSIKNAIFLGHISKIEEKKALYKNCTAVLLPSLYEAFPMVILEAMAFGKPIIASNVGGIPEIIKNGINGFLVEPKTPIEIEKYLDILASDPEIGNIIGKRNRELIEAEYTYKNMAQKTIQIYEKMIS